MFPIPNIVVSMPVAKPAIAPTKLNLVEHVPDEMIPKYQFDGFMGIAKKYL